MFRVLSIDGGGFRGVFAAHILKRMEEEFKISSWVNQFDLFAGTSTGSIIAAGLVCGLRASEICQLYESLGNKVFRKRWCCKIWKIGWIPAMFMSPYSTVVLKKELDKAFGNKRLGDYPSTPLIIPATDIANGGVHVFKTSYDPEFVRDPEERIADAVLASCSAPTYFDPYRTNKYMLADGGLWANNPSLAAVLDSKYRLKKNLDEIKVLSIGTGESKTFYPMRETVWDRMCGWGFLSRWKRSQLIDFILSLQSLSAQNMLGFLLPKENILRINYKTDLKEPMDDPKALDDLVSKADKLFTDESSKIRSFTQL